MARREGGERRAGVATKKHKKHKKKTRSGMHFLYSLCLKNGSTEFDFGKLSSLFIFVCGVVARLVFAATKA